MEPSITGPLTIGVDLAKTMDFTAIAATERRETEDERHPEFDVRMIARLPHQTKYRKVAKYLAQLVRNLTAEVESHYLARLLINPQALDEGPTLIVQARRRPENQLMEFLAEAVHELSVAGTIRIIADATGVGAAVVELIEEETEDLDCKVIAATFRFGDMLNWDTSGGLVVGKARLVQTLKRLLQEEALQVDPDDPLAALAVQEIEDYQIRVNDLGNEQYGAFSVGKHDDVATAIGLSVLERPGSRSLPTAVSRTWLPSWEHGIMSSEEEETWTEAQKAARQQRVDGLANTMRQLDQMLQGRW